MRAVSTFLAAVLPSLHMLDGSGFPSESAEPLTLMFWRADCPPCLVELKNASAYIDAGRPGRVMFVGLQDQDASRRAGARYGAPPEAMAQADGDPETVLAAYGAHALPFTAIFAPSGEVCYRHEGLLGTEALHQGFGACGGGDARH